MKNTSTNNLALFLLKGVIIGLVATQALDLVGQVIYDREDEKTKKDENEARDGRQAYEVGVAKMAKSFGVKLSREQEKVWGWRFHKTFGVLGGIQYLAMREKYPATKSAWGLMYGASFFLVADEILIYLAKLTPGPQYFNWKVHARGAIAHTAYGVAAETAPKALENFPKLLIREDKAYLRPQKMAYTGDFH